LEQMQKLDEIDLRHPLREYRPLLDDLPSSFCVPIDRNYVQRLIHMTGIRTQFPGTRSSDIITQQKTATRILLDLAIARMGRMRNFKFIDFPLRTHFLLICACGCAMAYEDVYHQAGSVVMLLC
jgi:hypothetical protein